MQPVPFVSNSVSSVVPRTDAVYPGFFFRRFVRVFIFVSFMFCAFVHADRSLFRRQ